MAQRYQYDPTKCRIINSCGNVNFVLVLKGIFGGSLQRTWQNKLRETLCESGRWIDALKKRERVLQKRGRVLKKRGRVLKKRRLVRGIGGGPLLQKGGGWLLKKEGGA